MAYVIDPSTGVPSLSESLTAEEKSLLVDRVNGLTQEGKPGVTMDALRPFYPSWDWNELSLHLNELVSAGTLVKKMHRPQGAKVAYEFYGVAQ